MFSEAQASKSIRLDRFQMSAPTLSGHGAFSADAARLREPNLRHARK